VTRGMIYGSWEFCMLSLLITPLHGISRTTLPDQPSIQQCRYFRSYSVSRTCKAENWWLFLVKLRHGNWKHTIKMLICYSKTKRDRVVVKQIDLYFPRFLIFTEIIIVVVFFTYNS
jgi:hypothetical protein